MKSIKDGRATRRRPAVPVSPQRKKDPAFMEKLEAAIAGEFAKAKKGAAPPETKVEALPVEKAPHRQVAAKSPKVKQVGAKEPSAARAVVPGRKSLAAELTALIPELDAEGLAFLIEQARVHLYNMKVQDLEAAAEEAENASARAGKLASAKGGSSRAKAGVPAGSGDFTIQAASDGSAYDLVWQGKWKMFTGEEMLSMVRIALNNDPASEVGARLYRWFVAERKDVLQDIPFAGMADPKLKAIVALLRKTFTVKGGKQR